MRVAVVTDVASKPSSAKTVGPKGTSNAARKGLVKLLRKGQPIVPLFAESRPFASSSPGGFIMDVNSRSRRAKRPIVISAILCLIVVGLAVPAGALQVDKWWTNKLGEFDSSHWNTSASAAQTLTVDRCNHNWGAGNQNIRVELREDKFGPDVSHGSFWYACNAGNHTNNNDDDPDVSWVSGNTPDAQYFFKWDPNVNLRSSGIIEIVHS